MFRAMYDEKSRHCEKLFEKLHVEISLCLKRARLSYFNPVLHFYTHRERQNTKRFFSVFRRCRNGTLD